jgi:integrase
MRFGSGAWPARKADLDLTFPNRSGKIESHANIIWRAFKPAQVAAGITVDGKAKYTGLHALRHFYASWCINRKADGGLELPVVQERMGHASITITMDTYGHLFPSHDDGDELATAAAHLFVVSKGLDTDSTWRGCALRNHGADG